MDDLGGLLAVVCANARSIEAKRGMLGLLNWTGSKLLTLAHRRRESNAVNECNLTRRPQPLSAVRPMVILRVPARLALM